MDSELALDLGSSGLIPEDLQAREVSPVELAATAAPSTATGGYVIPYWDVNGNPIPFYRIKLYRSTPKYKQPKDTGNHVYFPPLFSRVLEGNQYVLLTEGEKKAAAAVKAGIPCAALGGVDSWRNRMLVLPGDTKLSAAKSSNRKTIQAKLPSTLSLISESYTLAEGMQELIDLVLHQNKHLILVYDSDLGTGLKSEVQRAAASLGYELRYRGISTSHIRQLILPMQKGNGQEKVGLDDYLVGPGPKALAKLIDETLAKRSAFPRHPNPRAFINTKLEKNLNRKDCQSVALAILTELDARGRRLKSKATSVPYYFDETTHRLMTAPLMHRHGEPLHESVFGNFIYKNYGLSGADTRVITWLASQFTGEDPIEHAEPQRVLAKVPDTDNIAFQISDSQFVVVTGNPKNPLTLHDNGSLGLLFEEDQVDPIDAKDLDDAFWRQRDKPIKPWWLEIFQSLNLTGDEHAKVHAALLYYISPWLNRWRGTQLPVEILCGEAGSGKSSIMSLRLSILTGRPHLRNIPTDLRDWHASIAHTGGLHVTDNVQFTNKELKQRISDEICRITTEPDPHVEMRKLYTTSTQTRVPVRTTFAMTAIQQPFFNADFIQRSATFTLEALMEAHDGDWVAHQLAKRKGRIQWMAHHLNVLHKFLVAAKDKKQWSSNYKASHRLAHYEQALILMAKVLGIKVDWLASMLQATTRDTLSEADWAFEGLQEFAKEQDESVKFTSADISNWAQTNDEYVDNTQLANARRLGKYMTAHKNTIMKATGITEVGRLGNRRLYKVVK